MNKYFLAIDIGASGGRYIIGWLENGQILGDAVSFYDLQAANHLKDLELFELMKKS